MNPVTGRATLIGSTGLPAVTFVPFSENPDGTLNIFGGALFSATGKPYATFDTGKMNPESGEVTPVIDNNLYQIDSATGKGTLIGPTTFALDTVVDVNGTFYGFKNNTGQIVTLNLANGQISPVSNLDRNAELIFGTTPVPEPGSLALAAFGIAGLVAYRQRRHLTKKDS